MNLPRRWWNYIVVIDCESTGLHGRTFAVGAVVFKDGVETEAFFGYTHNHVSEAGTHHIAFPHDEDDVRWVQKNVLVHFEGIQPTDVHSRAMKDRFWKFWQRHADAGAVLVADVPWPVEAAFLSECIRWDFPSRKWQGPYPLIDVASILAFAGEEYLPEDDTAHHPVHDARRSAHTLLSAINGFLDVAGPQA